MIANAFLALLGVYLACGLLFAAVTEILFPYVTEEILLMRAFGTAALLLLQVILCIGPLCRLNPKFLPLLYNRRHAGVTAFLLALVHAVMVVLTYHADGDLNPISSIFASSPLTGTAGNLPFQPVGFFALLILFLMAATSHDFWLANLSAPVWKSLHMLVYAAYGLLILHVTFGILQSEFSPVYVVALFPARFQRRPAVEPAGVGLGRGTGPNHRRCHPAGRSLDSTCRPGIVPSLETLAIGAP